MSIQAIVTDIEGTTSDMAFVHDVLFPYAARELPAFVRARSTDPAVADALEDVRGVMGAPDADLELAITQLLEWMARDEPVTPLRTLQGLVWRQGYENGDFTGHVHTDAAEAMRLWHQAGVALYVFSSASTSAQQLLFGHSNHGDLTPLFSGHFDTTVGGKREAISYRLIRNTIGASANQILYLSDVVGELDAAAEAGLTTCLVARDGTPDTTNRHAWARDFASIPQLCGARAD